MQSNPKTITYFFTERQVHDPCSFSKSPLKPALLHRIIQEDPKFSQVETRIEPVELERMKQVHAPAYIDGLVAGDIADGFGNKSKKDMQAIRTTVGNFVAAAKYALTTSPIVWSLTSGFHHAGYAGGGGFCTINGLMVAAFELWKFHNARTLIVDEDFHFFDGCVGIMKHKPEMKEYVAMLSSKYTHGTHEDVNLKARRAELEVAIAKHSPDIIMYQMGVDMWIDDPLGGSLSGKQLYQRDLDTFDVAKRHGTPVVANLAGGYAMNYNDTLQLHMNSGEAMKEIYLGLKGRPVFPKEYSNAAPC